MGGVVRIFKSIVSPSSTPAYQAPVAAPVAAPEPVAAPDEVVLAPEAEAPPAVTEQETLLKKKKKGRYNTILSGKEGSLGAANVERKSLLGN